MLEGGGVVSWIVKNGIGGTYFDNILPGTVPRCDNILQEHSPQV